MQPSTIKLSTPFRTPSTATSSPTCDGAFHAVASPNGPIGNQLYATSAVSPNDVWAVGVQNLSAATNEIPLALHWNGSSWSAISPPNPGPFWADLNGVVALASNNVWAIGDYLVSNGVVHGFAAHWNGSSWSINGSLVNPTPLTFLFAIDADSPTDIWAAGIYNSAGLFTLVEHYNGTTWSQSPVLQHTGPSNQFENNFLFSVSAFSSTDVWVGGEYDGKVETGFFQALAEHWDGANWNFVAPPQLAGDNVIAFLKAPEAGHAIAVGGGEDNPSVGEAWNLLAGGGSTNSIVTGSGTGDNLLEGVSINGAAAWAVGLSTATPGGLQQTLAIPGTWRSSTHTLTWGTQVASASPSTINNVLNAVAVTSLYGAAAVGDDTNLSGNDQTLTESYCARHFTLAAPATTTAGTPFSITVTATNSDGSRATGYLGTVHFTSSDPSATLPSDYAFTAPDAGQHTFSGVVLMTPCTPQSITVADTANPFTVPGSGTVARFFTAPCPASPSATGARGAPGPATSPSGGAARVGPGSTTGPGTGGIRTPHMMGETGQASALSSATSAQTAMQAGATSAQAATRTAVGAAAASAASDHAMALTGDDAAPPPAIPVSLPTRTVSASSGHGQPPLAALIVLVLPAALAVGLRRRKVQERSHVKTRP